MMHTYVLTWICGHAVWTWKWLSFTEWSRLTHYTGAMIKLKAAKLVVGGALILCAGTGARYLPGVWGGDLSETAFGPARYQRHAVPEPSALGLLVGGVGILLIVKRKTRQ